MPSKTVRKRPRTFSGSEIVPALIAAFEAWPNEAEPAEISAGENMEITATFAVESGGVIVGFDTIKWSGSEWLLEELATYAGH